MLARQNFGWRHEGGLCATFYRLQHGHERDHCFAGADIALNEPQHASFAGHVLFDIANGGFLGSGQIEGQGSQQFLPQIARAGQLAAGLRAPVSPHQCQH